MSGIEAPAPRAFISHASEDKQRFVLPLATGLLAGGVEAWVDQWEMQPGDSLVNRIFEHGIASADAFVVVLSNVSVTKPWVREELDAALVQRINSEGRKRLIPVILDEGVEVPVAVQHLLWLSVAQKGLEGVVDDVLRTLHGRSAKPEMGVAPTYLRRPSAWLDDPVDDLVFGLIVEEWRKHGLNTVLFSDEVQTAAASQGVGAEAFAESMEMLERRRMVQFTAMAGGQRWWLKGIPDRIWLQLEEQRGVDLDDLRRELLSRIVNEGATRLLAEDLGVHDFTLKAVLGEFARDGLVSSQQILNGGFAIGEPSALARRALRDG